MKTIIKLLIAVVVLNACVRFGMSAWRYYEFKDAVEQEARFGGSETAATLHERVLGLAEQHEIEIEPTDVTVDKRGTATVVSAAYLENIELVPTIYTREHLFEFELSVYPVRPISVEDIK